MINKENYKVLFRLSVISSLLAAIVSLSGITNIQIYSPITPNDLLPGAMSQDIVSLISAIGIVISIRQIIRGSNLAWLAWLGFTGYLLYAYAIYSFDRVYTNFFLLYIAVFGLSLYSIILFFIYSDLSKFDFSKNKKLPRKSVGVYFLLLVIMFLMVWLSIVVPAILNNKPPEGNSIFVLDLSFFLPLLTIGAFQLFAKKPFGDFLASILLIKMGILGFSVFLGEILRPLFEQQLNFPMISLFAFLGLGSILLAVIFISKLKDV
jgi:hypothetical protein